MLKSKRIKNLLACVISCFLLLSSTVVSIAAKDNSNEPYSKFNAMLTRLFSGNITNITVQKNGMDITNQFINENSPLFEANQFDIIIDLVADNEIIFEEPATIVPYGIQTSVHISNYMYGVAKGTSSISGGAISLPFIYRISITASYNDATGKVSGTPRVTVLAELDGIGDSIKVSNIDHFTLVVNDGYSVQCTRVSFDIEAYGSLDGLGIWQKYDRFTWSGLIKFSPAG